MHSRSTVKQLIKTLYRCWSFRQPTFTKLWQMDASPLAWFQSTCGQFSLTLQGAEDAGRTCAQPMMVMYSYLAPAPWLQTTNFNVEMRFWTQYSSKYFGVKFRNLSKSAKCKKNCFHKGSKAMFGLMLLGKKDLTTQARLFLPDSIRPKMACEPLSKQLMVVPVLLCVWGYENVASKILVRLF